MRKFFLWALVLSLVVTLPASAQETRGNISGTVKDNTGVLPGATVLIVNTDTGAKQELTAVQMQPPGRQQRYKIQPVKGKPAQPTVALGWLDPAELLDISIDATEGKMTQFQITVDKTDGVRVMQLKRVMRDSNKEIRLSLNSSAFGPGDYLVRIDAYNWRGQTEEYGWFMLGLQ